jgi:hypothetical protein
MRKGCFVKVIIILTILTAAVLYIIQYRFDDLIKEPAKKFISGLAADEIAKEFDFVKDSPEKDSLIAIAADFVASKSDLIDSYSKKDAAYIKERLNFYLRDSIITKEELEQIKNEIKELDERSKKD